MARMIFAGGMVGVGWGVDDGGRWFGRKGESTVGYVERDQ